MIQTSSLGLLWTCNTKFVLQTRYNIGNNIPGILKTVSYTSE